MKKAQPAEINGARTTPTDAMLLKRVRDGDERAFEQLAAFHFQAAWRVAARVLRNDGEAEDVAQEALLKVWQNPPDLDSEASLRPWVLRVASNGAIDRLRKKKPDLLGDALPERNDPAPRADNKLVADDATGQVQDAIENLPERQRLALVLTYYEGLPNKDAAKALEVSVDALESLLSRARRALKAALSEHWDGLLADISHGKVTE
ncbi:MAG: RNA polymerase sigma factor [Hyphomicrobiales bacterium]